MESAVIKNNENLIAQQDHSAPLNILAVDDERFVIEYLVTQIKGLGHNLFTAENGKHALTFLEGNKDKIDVVIMDWAMPVMDGLEAIRHMKKNPAFRNIPVIMITGSDKGLGIEKGLEAGIFYYLTKPVKKTVLHSVLASAGRAARQNKTLAQELKKHRASFSLIESCRFTFKTIADAENLAVFMANCFPDPERVLPGLGELLINAIEHGNLGIGYERKHDLIETGTWRAEIERLEKLPEHAGKTAIATISRKEDGIYVVVEDQGDGFVWKKYITVDPARAGDNHGRGIAQAKAVSFDKLTYNEKGNKAVAFVQYKGKLEW